ncbi:MAG: hypothetical protein U0401_21610 [Anaerolineae bacterium]
MLWFAYCSLGVVAAAPTQPAGHEQIAPNQDGTEEATAEAAGSEAMWSRGNAQYPHCRG